MKTIILGLGNTILTDDGAGIYVSRRIKELLHTMHDEKCIKVEEASVGGFNFIDVLTGYNRAVIIDAIHTKDGKPGEYYELNPDCLRPSARISSLHGIDFATVREMAEKMDVDFPKEIKIYVLEAEDEFTFSEKCTEIVEKSIEPMAKEIIESLKKSEWI